VRRAIVRHCASRARPSAGVAVLCQMLTTAGKVNQTRDLPTGSYAPIP